VKPFRVGSLAGIPILLHPSWFLLLGFVTWILASGVFPDWLEGRSYWVYVAMALCTVVVFFASIVAHELAHSLVAKAYRIPVRSITLFIFGGVAQITREAKRPFSELLVAVAGPLMSFLLGLAFMGLWWAFGAREDRPVDVIFLWLSITNFALGIFNMIPAFPMDGGRVFRSLLWMISHNYYRATEIAAWTGRAFGWAMMGGGLLLIFGPGGVPRVADQGFWFMLIGFFLETVARQNLVQARAVRALDRYNAEDLMLSDPPVVERDVAVGLLARGVIELNPRVCYFVEDHGKLAGILSAYQMLRIPEARWDATTAGQAMVPSNRLRAVGPDRKASEVLMEMEEDDLTHLPVVREGRVVGVVGRDRLLGILRQAGFLRAAGT
jgi:Zn-dependent protease